MPRLTLQLPGLYGDHHVVEVRALLSALPGVQPVMVSAAWQAVVLDYDPAQIGPGLIRQALRARGYTDEPRGVPGSTSRTQPSAGLGPGAIQALTPIIPTWSPPGPCPGFEIRQPSAGGSHPADA